MSSDDSAGLDSSGIFYVTQGGTRRKLTRGAQWAVYAFAAGLMIGFFLTRTSL